MDPLTTTLDAVHGGAKSGNWALVISTVMCVLCVSNSLFGFVGAVPFLGGALQLIGVLALAAWLFRRKKSEGPAAGAPQSPFLFAYTSPPPSGHPRA